MDFERRMAPAASNSQSWEVMSAHSPGLTAETVQDSLDRRVHSLRNWRIALGAYAVLGALAAGMLSAEAAAILVFAGFSAIAIFVVRLKAEVASLRMHRQFRRIAEMRSNSREPVLPS